MSSIYILKAQLKSPTCLKFETFVVSISVNLGVTDSSYYQKGTSGVYENTGKSSWFLYLKIIEGDAINS